jgi:beta-lactamase superfamily II metal-dependent hydrolase
MRKMLGLGLCLAAMTASAQNPARSGLDVYVVDVEGGNATLFVAPSGQSMLIDTGNGGQAADRDAGRIMAAMKDAGIARIDYLVTTHYHGDHFGAMSTLASRVPVGAYVDHGPSVQSSPATDAFLKEVYPGLWKRAAHTVVAPGDRIPVAGLEVTVVSSAGRVLSAPLAGAGASNPHCAASPRQADDATENAQSVGAHVALGRFRALHLGDLTWNKELDLMCPANRIGTVDVYIVSHHGQPSSNSPALVHAIEPRAALMNNGTRKGGQPEAMRILHAAPRLEDLWQIHFSLLSGQDYTVPGLFIANTVDEQPEQMPIAALTPPPPGPGGSPPPAHDGPAYWLKVSARADGSFTVSNARNGFSKAYAAAR